MRDVTIVVDGMHCAACGLLIDDIMLDLDGVVDSVTNTKTGLCRVRASDEVGDAQLIDAVVEAGYRGVIA